MVPQLVPEWRGRCTISVGMNTWKCTICGFVSGDESAPAHCPECGAVVAMFVPSTEPPHGIPHNPLQPRDEREQGAFSVGPGHGCVEND
jgi:rubredoxin